MMEDFKAGRLDALVSTTVIEVGVDVPKCQRNGDRKRRALRSERPAPAARPRGTRCSGELVLSCQRQPKRKRTKAAEIFVQHHGRLCGGAVRSGDPRPRRLFGSRQHGLPPCRSPT